MNDQILTQLLELAAVLDQEKDPYTMMDLAVVKLKDFFAADSGWLLYPCDLTTPSCHIKYALTSPGFKHTFADFETLPLQGELFECFTKLYQTSGSMIWTAEGDGSLFGELHQACSVKSQLAMVVRMKNVRPWVIGLHQCSSARVWSSGELDFFQYAVDRIREGFDSKFFLGRGKKERGAAQDKDRSSVWSEKRFSSLFHISSISLCLGDFSAMESWFEELRKSGVSSLDSSLGVSVSNLKKVMDVIRYFDMNRATLDLFEATDKQELSFAFHRCFTYRTLPGFMMILEALYTRKKHIAVEVPFRTLKGKLIDTILSVDVLAGQEANKILVSITDISIQKDSERKLIASIEKYRQLLETANDAIFIIDAENGNILEANRKASELIGKPVGEIIGQHRTELHAPEDWFYYKELFETQFKVDRTVEQRETAVLHADGYKVPVEISVSKISIDNNDILLGIFHDIRGRLEHVKRQKLLATAIEKIDESVIITDSLGNIEYVNSAFEEVSGYTSEEVLGKKPGLMKNDVHNDAHYQLMWQTISNGDVWRGQFVNTKKDGTLYQEDVTVTPVMDSRGRVQHYVAVNRDITKQVAIENHLRQSQKMQAIGTLAGGIAHDFNNILTPIMGFAEMSLLRAGDDKLLRANMLEIVSAADRAGKLIDQILSFSKQAEKKIASLPVKTIVEEVLNLLRASLSASIEIFQDLDSNAKIRVDPTQLHQVIMNLCTNAYQAIGNRDGGIIRISLRSVTIGKRQGVEMGHINFGKYARIRVEDNGRGIPKEFINRIFDPYFTTRNVNEGNGLGLSVVHGIVNEYGGAVLVDSEPGRGSCFDVYLPEIDKADVPCEQV
jgi:PAS domain S-box-containing protein